MTRKIHTSRPKSIGAQVAWDRFTKQRGTPPRRMWYTCLTYWVWVAEWEAEDFEEIDFLELRDARFAELERRQAIRLTKPCKKHDWFSIGIFGEAIKCARCSAVQWADGSADPVKTIIIARSDVLA